MNLEQQLNAYAEFLDAESLERLPDHITEPNQGDVTVVDLLTRDEHEAPEADDGGWGRRTPLLMAAAAAVLLFIAIAYFLPDSSSEPLDTVDIPEEQLDTPGVSGVTGENAADGNVDVATRMESAGDGLPELLATVLDPEVAVTVDGFEFPEGPGFEWLTDSSMSSLVDIEISGCEGTGTVRCDTVLEFPFLAGNAVPQLGMLEFVESEGKIVEYTSTTTNLDEAVEGLSLYRGWAIVSGVEDDLFTDLDTIRFDAEAAVSHELRAPEFLEAIDVSADSERIATLVSSAVAGGHTETLEQLFGGETFLWDFNGFSGGFNPADLIAVLAGPVYEGILQSRLESCTFFGSETLTCRADVTYRHSPNVTAGNELITMTIAGDQITEWRVATSNVDSYFGGIADYSEWVVDNRPDAWGAMFDNSSFFQNTAESAALHAEIGPIYNDTLAG